MRYETTYVAGQWHLTYTDEDHFPDQSNKHIQIHVCNESLEDAAADIIVMLEAARQLMESGVRLAKLQTQQTANE